MNTSSPISTASTNSSRRNPNAVDPVLLSPSMRPRVNLLLVLIATALAYVSILRFSFVFDDVPFILYNPELRSWSFVPQYFHEHVWAFKPGTLPLYYRPFFVLVLRCCYALFGIKPMGWHAVSLAFHLLATFLVYRVARRLLASETAALIAAILFGLHPIHAESVAWIDGLTDPLVTSLLLAAFLIYLRDRQRPRLIPVLAFSLLFAAALLTKEPALFFIPVLAVYAFTQPSPSRRAELPWFTTLLLLTVAYFPLRQAALGTFAQRHHHAHAIKLLLFTEPSLWWFYLRHLVFPFHLSAAYEFPIVRAFSAREVLLPLITFLLLTALLVLLFRRLKHQAPSVLPIALTALAWFLFFLAPALDLILMAAGDYVHDRYLYLPSVGFALLVAIFFTPLFDTLSTSPRRAVAITAVALLAFACCLEAAPWRDNGTLYTRALETAPHNTTMRNNLGGWLIDNHRLPEAIAQLQRVLADDPHHAGAYVNLAIAYELQGDLRKARDAWATAESLEPNPEIERNLSRLNQSLSSQQ